ncbi:MAG: phytanoyl-CoA dioxygenase family protein [Myxococcota bacterium]
MNVSQHASEYRERGYTVLRGLFRAEECDALLADVHRNVAREETTLGASTLSHGGIVYTGGIYVHSEATRRALTSPRVLDVLTAIAGPDLWVTMDQAVLKHPGAGVFRWHQDNGYNQLKREHFQLWIALTDTEKANGALMLAPGSHRRGLLPHAYRGEGQVEVTAPVGDTVTVDATKGDVILFSSLMLHATGPNEAESTRVAYVAEFMRLRDYAPAATAPFFVAAEGGAPAGRFTDEKPGARDPRNHLLYLPQRAEKAARNLLRPLKRRLLGQAPS